MSDVYCIHLCTPHDNRLDLFFSGNNGSTSTFHLGVFTPIPWSFGVWLFSIVKDLNSCVWMDLLELKIKGFTPLVYWVLLEISADRLLDETKRLSVNRAVVRKNGVIWTSQMDFVGCSDMSNLFLNSSPHKTMSSLHNIHNPNFISLARHQSNNKNHQPSPSFAVSTKFPDVQKLIIFWCEPAPFS